MKVKFFEIILRTKLQWENVCLDLLHNLSIQRLMEYLVLQLICKKLHAIDHPSIHLVLVAEKLQNVQF